jgi:hypothetical protein
VLGQRADGIAGRPPRGGEHQGRRQRGKNRRGRQRARVSAPPYPERLGSRVSPGNQTSQAGLRPTVAAVERGFGVPLAARRRTVRRLDGGFGTDAHRNGALWPGYQVRATGDSGQRAQAFAQAGPWGEARRPGERWIAPAPTALHEDRRPQTAVVPWQAEHGAYTHRLLTTALMAYALAALAETDDDRAAIDAERKAETGGLQRHRRRQPRLAAQEALVVRTDLAPNRLAWTREWSLRDAPCADAGIDRIVKELVPIPGTVGVEAGQSVKRRLKASHPRAKPMLVCLARLFHRVGTPGILRKS